MNCPVCSQESIVLKTVALERRRRCTSCGHRFSTTEMLTDEHRRQAELLEDARKLAEKLAA